MLLLDIGALGADELAGGRAILVEHHLVKDV